MQSYEIKTLVDPKFTAAICAVLALEGVAKAQPGTVVFWGFLGVLSYFGNKRFQVHSDKLEVVSGFDRKEILFSEVRKLTFQNRISLNVEYNRENKAEWILVKGAEADLARFFQDVRLAHPGVSVDETFRSQSPGTLQDSLLQSKTMVYMLLGIFVLGYLVFQLSSWF